MKAHKLFKLCPPTRNLASFQGEETAGRVCSVASLLKSAIHSAFSLCNITDYQQFGELSSALDKSAANGGSAKRDQVHRIETASPALATPVDAGNHALPGSFVCLFKGVTKVSWFTQRAEVVSTGHIQQNFPIKPFTSTNSAFATLDSSSQTFFLKKNHKSFNLCRALDYINRVKHFLK